MANKSLTIEEIGLLLTELSEVAMRHSKQVLELARSLTSTEQTVARIRERLDEFNWQISGLRDRAKENKGLAERVEKLEAVVEQMKAEPVDSAGLPKDIFPYIMSNFGFGSTGSDRPAKLEPKVDAWLKLKHYPEGVKKFYDWLLGEGARLERLVQAPELRDDAREHALMDQFNMILQAFETYIVQ